MLIAFTGCQKHQIEKQLTTLEKILHQDSDSAFKLLKKFDASEIKQIKNQAKYALLFNEIYFKKRLPVPSDSLTRIALDYYAPTTEYTKIAKANFYLGKIIGGSDSIQKAIQYLVNAEQYASKAGNTLLLGLIYNELGQLYLKQFSTVTALNYFHKARQSFDFVQDSSNANYVLGDIARCYLHLQQPDSSLSYYQLAKKNAEQRNDQEYLAYVNRCLIPVFLDSHRIREAKAFINQCFRENQNKFLYFYSLSDCYLHDNQYDSAELYLNRIISDTSFNLSLKQKIAVYFKLKKIAAKHKDYRVLYRYSLISQRLTDSLTTKIRKEDILRIEKKYRNALLANQNHLLQINNNRKTILLLILIGLVIILLCLTVIIDLYRKKILRQKQTQIDKYLALIEALNQEHENHKNNFMEQLNESVERERQLQKALSKRLNIVKQLTDLLYKYGTQEKTEAIFSHKVKEIMNINVLTQDTLVDLLIIVNANYHGIIDFLQANYGLSKEELELCSFICSGFTPQEISILYNISVDNVYIRCSRLGKKMELRIPLTTYLKVIMENLKSNKQSN